MATFDIIEYLSSLTGFNIDKAVLKRIAMERNALDITDYNQLEQKQKDLMLADILFTIYVSPSTTSSISKKHGQFSQSIGSQVITDKRGLRELMVSLYSKWGDDKLESVNDIDGGLQWLSFC